ncbi:mitotic checkpoint protein BUB3-like protein [Gorgonomyces haynaldii]|nr:mitotic checkpoint protein BUB3-like protein [Gorgonomyces haynaldii]
MTNHDLELKDCPEDAISRTVFSPLDPALLCVSSWDSTVRVYDVVQNKLMAQYKHNAPVLDACFHSGLGIVSGGLDRTVKLFDLADDTERTLGKHADAISCITVSGETVISGSWDKTCKIFDTRGNSSQILDLPDKIFTIDCAQSILVVGTAQRHILVYDLRNLGEPLQKRESSLKHMTRRVSVLPEGSGFLTGCIEGRIAVDYLNTGDQHKKYAFKCHRKKEEDTEYVYPVNAMAHHPTQQDIFVSGGGDGVVNMWNVALKKRVRQYTPYPTSISSLSFSCDGTRLAVASSYTFEEGDKEHPKDTIYIKNMS